MLPEELLRRVRQIEITTRKMVDDVMSGQYRTHFKGHGMQFSEHRIYVPGDDVRHIDWKVSARSREPVTKKYEEERELVVLLIVDISASGGFGSGKKLKAEVAAEIGGMLAYAASQTGDKVGVILFGGKVEKVLPPKKGRQHILRIIRDLLSFEKSEGGTDLKGALESAHRVMKHRGVIFLLSDFIAEDYELQLRKLARRHNVVAVSIADEREALIPDLGHFLFVDPETGVEQMVDTGSFAFKKWLKETQLTQQTDFSTAIKRGKIEHLKLATKEDYGEAVVRFFRARSRKR